MTLGTVVCPLRMILSEDEIDAKGTLAGGYDPTTSMMKHPFGTSFWIVIFPSSIFYFYDAPQSVYGGGRV
jgi:hypothetical protein